jgi:cell wall-associated NlpC family hydrolase
MVADLQNKMSGTTEEYNQTRDALDASNKRHVALVAQLGSLRGSVAAAEKVVSQFAASAYRGSNMSMLTITMNSGSPQTFLDQMATLEVLNANQRADLDQLLAARKALTAQQQKIDLVIKNQLAESKALQARRTQIQGDLVKWTSLRDRYGLARASRSSSRQVPVSYAGPASGSARIAVSFAYAQLGKPYVWGASGPGSYDCSGLTSAAWRAAGVSMPHSARGQYNSFPRVSLSDLQPGDLIYYPGHISIYVGDGMAIHAPTTGDVVKKVPYQNAGSVIGAVRPS